MTEQELISKLRQLKQIKPNTTWVSLAKANILGTEPKVIATPAVQWNLPNMFGAVLRSKLAYSLAALLFVVAGVVGVLNYQAPGAPQVASVKSQADLSAENTLKSNVADFKLKSQNLAEAVKDKSQNPGAVIKEVKDAATSLTQELQKNPGLAKVIALDVNNNKSLLNIPGGLKEVSDAYKEIDEQLIKDIDSSTLTPEKQVTLSIIKDYMKKSKYSAALENILINFNISN